MKYTVLHTGRNRSEIDDVLAELELEKEISRDPRHDLLSSIMSMPIAEDTVEGVTIWRVDLEDGEYFFVVGVLLTTGTTYFATTHHRYSLSAPSVPTLPFPAVSVETLEKARLWDGLMFATRYKLSVKCDVDELTQVASAYCDEKEMHDAYQRREQEKK